MNIDLVMQNDLNSEAILSEMNRGGLLLVIGIGVNAQVHPASVYMSAIEPLDQEEVIRILEGLLVSVKKYPNGNP